MSNSTTNLDQVSFAQIQKEVLVNELLAQAWPATALARHDSACAALTWAYNGGNVAVAGVPTYIANGTLSLTDNATCYIYLDGDALLDSPPGTPVAFVTSPPTGWPARDGNLVPLYQVTSASGAVTAWTDWRTGDPAVPGTTPATYLGGVTVTSDGRVSSGTTTAPFDAAAFYPGIPSASAVVVRVPLARAVNFAANFAGSYGKASANATSSAAFDIKKNASSVGTITFAGGASTATFVSAGGAAQSFAAGDVLSIIAPGTPDATLADPGFVLAGMRSP